MLSLLLSWLFRLAFVVLLVFGIVEIIVQVRQKPIILDKKAGRYSSIGQPGIGFRAMRSDVSEKMAPDTSVNFIVRTAPENRIISSGGFSWGHEPMISHKTELDSMCTVWKKNKDSVTLDTVINLIRHREFDLAPLSEAMIAESGISTGANGQAIVETVFIDSAGKQAGKPKRDTFPDKQAAEVFQITGSRTTGYRLSEEGTKEELLRIRPANTTQHILFVLYELLLYFFAGCLLLTLSRLFRNFYKNNYFTPENVRLLRNTGWYVLIPQLLQAAVYWRLLMHIHPVKILVRGAGEVRETAGFEFISGTNMIYTFLGLGLLVLSYIFKNGLLLKEENASFI